MDILLLVLGFLLGALLVYFFMGKRKTKTVRFDATIILEKIKSVSKLITVEGNYSEVIHYNESRPKWLSLIPNHKKAIIMVKAKAMVGFDLTKAEFEVNLENHSISISNRTLFKLDSEKLFARSTILLLYRLSRGEISCSVFIR